MREISLVLVWLIFGFSISYGQDFSKNTLFGGIGIGSSNNSSADGLGVSWTAGYQRDIWNNRLRITPHLSFGSYTSKGTTDVPDAYFNSFNLKMNLNFDVLKIKSFSLTIGTGLTANYSSGLIGTGGWPPGSNSSNYFNQSNFSFNGLIGFRLNPAKRRIGYELLLLDGSFENKKYFSELTVLRAQMMVKI